VKIGVVTFPGSNSDVDSLNALTVAGVEAVRLWHESPDLAGVSAVILPGGFAYGDYIRAGVIARFSPVMGSVKDFAAAGGYVLGICNGFQVLAESGLVPGALLRNRSLRFAGRLVNIKPERLDSPLPVLPPVRRCASRLPTARAATTPTRRRWTRSSATARSSSDTSTTTARRRWTRTIRRTRTARCGQSQASATPPATWPA
jgi:putative intracellular protease/amidase